ncbi:hypothetical protein EV127DRAFT_104076 [Xylaria flabelliformis]|nr:hypothetical protein EV127DRAFT_104076 [Xylaria flabelliformis]
MPKRSYDTSTSMGNAKVPPAKVQKTERSHEENQERAYIAASRRTDRSLEARVQSAKMASDIHRKRTGRGLRVSEEIVLKEEMYEEMEDEIPRHYKYLTAHLETGSPEMNRRLTAFVTSQTAMAAMAKYNDIDKMFNEAFPQVANFSQQAQSPLYGCGIKQHHSSPSAFIPGSAVSSNNKNHSISAQSQFSNRDKSNTEASPAPTPYLSPATTSSDATEPISPPYRVAQSAFRDLPLDPQLTQQPSCSFTSELPNEIKMMTYFNMNNPFFYGEGTPSAFPMVDGCGGGTTSLHRLESGESDGQDCSKTSNESFQAFIPGVDASSVDNEALLTPPGSFLPDNFTTSGPGPDGWESFDSFVDLDIEQ